MKYIKTFEAVEPKEYGEYWKINTDTPYYEISLNKIGMPKDVQKDYIDSDIKRSFKRYEFIFILKAQANNPSGFDWSWSDYESAYKKKFRNMGEVEITTEDIEEWELNKNANKYNL